MLIITTIEKGISSNNNVLSKLFLKPQRTSSTSNSEVRLGLESASQNASSFSDDSSSSKEGTEKRMKKRIKKQENVGVFFPRQG